MNTYFIRFLLTLCITTLFACGSDNNNNNQQTANQDDIVEVARKNGSFTTLLTALETVDLDDVLMDTSRNFTVFAPTDAAFAKIDPAVLSALLADADRLRDILLYHVLPDVEIDSTAATAAAGSTVTTANTDELGIKLSGSNLLINDSTVVIPNVSASNGIIHAIDTVLIPTVDTASAGNIAEVATAAGTFTTLLGALATTGLDSTLSDASGKFTVFAPTDAAFAQLGHISGLTVDQLRDILLYHVIIGKEINSSAATAIAGNTVAMANMDNMALSLSGSDLFANLSGISMADVDASNGIIHVIDRVLSPPADPGSPTMTIFETAQANADFSTLVAALNATGLNNPLNDTSQNFTVFAPTNAAFDALGAGAVASLLMDLPLLTDILEKHVVQGAVDSVTAFTLNGTDVTTLNGETVALDIMPGELMVDDASIITFDIRTTNGIIHVIDAVIQLD